MMMPTDDLKALLLDMLSSARPMDIARTRPLTLQDWDRLNTMARQHRLMPLLHHQKIADVPSETAILWATAYRTAALRALSAQRGLIRAHHILAAAGIPYAALKGAWLAWHAYPHPALRPMRDLDLLVPAERALDAFEALTKAGFVRAPHQTMPLEHALAHHKHLPPLHCPSSRIALEIHTRLTDPQPAAVADIDDTAALMARRECHALGGVNIAYLSPTDTLLHLIVHAACDHRFDNGPLVLTDVALLLIAAPIDWPLFWALAKRGGWARGCRLVLALAATYHEGLRVDWPSDTPDPVPEAVHNQAALMMLQDFHARGETSLHGALGAARGAGDKLKIAGASAFPPRHVVAAFGGVDPASPLVWTLYPIRLVHGSAQWLAGLFSKSLRTEVQRSRVVGGWLVDR
jgi:Uncharacterised nucleotidyltransferase